MDENEEDLNKSFVIGGDTLTLADLAGISLDNVKELRGGEAFPKGVFAWEVSDDPAPHLAVVGEDKKAKGCVTFKLKCIDVLTISDADFDQNNKDSLIGKFHNETFFLSGDIEQALGYIKSFCKDIGAPYNPKLVENLKGCANVRFQAPIQKRKNKDDTDIVYTNINRLKIKPMAAAAGSEVAAAAAA